MKFVFYGTKEEYKRVIKNPSWLCQFIDSEKCGEYMFCSDCVRHYVVYGGTEHESL